MSTIRDLRYQIKKRLPLLQLGVRLKRWVFLIILGSMLIGMALVGLLVFWQRESLISSQLVNFVTLSQLNIGLRITILIVIGLLFIVVGSVMFARRIAEPFRNTKEISISESLTELNRRQRGPKVVTLGGGTGMPSILRSLRGVTDNVTAVVTVADDGGSSGRLRREFGMLPPGDFRNNIAALARDEALMTQLLQYRFGDIGGETTEVGGHSFGNLLIAALAGITGSFEEALTSMRKVLAMRGQVFPSTLDNVTLSADIILENNPHPQRIVGESKIPKAGGQIQRVYLEPKPKVYPPVIRAILQADLIILGPGSLYTSIMPNLLIPELAEALTHTRAKKIYICNLAIQPGETDNYTLAEHADAFMRHNASDCIDIILANNNLGIDPSTGGGATKYVLPTTPDFGELLLCDLVDEARPWRHDSQKLMEAIISVLN